MDRWLKLFESANPVVRKRAAAALLDHGEAVPLPVLLKILDDLFEQGLGAKIEPVLLKRRDAGLVSEMIARLRSPSQYIREVACSALGELRDRAATPHLLAMLGDEALMVRRAAAFALAALADPESGPAILRHYQTRPEDINVRMGLEAALNALGVPYEGRGV